MPDYIYDPSVVYPIGGETGLPHILKVKSDQHNTEKDAVVEPLLCDFIATVISAVPVKSVTSTWFFYPNVPRFKLTGTLKGNVGETNKSYAIWRHEDQIVCGFYSREDNGRSYTWTDVSMLHLQGRNKPLETKWESSELNLTGELYNIWSLKPEDVGCPARDLETTESIARRFGDVLIAAEAWDPDKVAYLKIETWMKTSEGKIHEVRHVWR